MATQTTITANKDIDYILKDYASSQDALVSFATVNFGPGTSANRLWTNFNVDSFSRNWLEIVAFIADVFFFYFDTQATQSYLQTATVRSAVNDIAKQFGFTPASATSASGNALFTASAAVPAGSPFFGAIPRGTKVKASNGQQFFVTTTTTIPAAGDYTVPVLQGIIKTESFNAQGLQNEEIDLAGPNVIRDLDNLNPLDVSPQITVNGNDYTLVSSFIRHNGTDTAAVTDSLGNVIGGGGRVYTLNQRDDGTPYIRFGDGVFGRKLAPGETVSVIYRTGGGSAGNIGEETLTTILDSVTNITAVSNSDTFSGGADEQSIEQLRDLIPASLRTLDRAVATTDYADILKATFTEVFDASAETNTRDPGVDLNVYVVPQGTGIPKISSNILLKNKLSSFLDRRKTVTVQFQIQDAFQIDCLITLEVFITNTASRATVSQAIVTAITEFFNLTTGGSQGHGISFAEDILLKNISNIVEGITGIERFEIKRLTYRPRIQEYIVGLLTTYNYTDITVFPTISESEWLLGAAGTITKTSDPTGNTTVLFSNSASTPFTYNSSTGEIQYLLPVDLSNISPGDLFRSRTAPLTNAKIYGVDTINNKVTLDTGLTVDGAPGLNAGGSIRQGATSYESFKCFKKILATATNLSVDTITDSNLDLSVLKGTATALSARVLLDNSQIFIPNAYSNGDHYLVDANGNIWDIISNDSNNIRTGISAINDAAVTSVTSGSYKIVKNLAGYQVVFNNNIFNVQYNTDNTVFSIAAQFNQIGTIGDEFQISKLQTNIGNLGVAVDIISQSSGTVVLNAAPNLEGVNSSFTLVDSTGQTFDIAGVDNRSLPSTSYPSTNRSNSWTLLGTGAGQQLAQGFKVGTTSTYAVISLDLKREGNILGTLALKIVADNGSGKPDLTTVIATAQTKSVTSVSNVAFTKTLFTFTSPPTLSAATQYHLVLSGDPSYNASVVENLTVFSNSLNVPYTYTSGTIHYTSAVNLASVLPGDFFKDGAGSLFVISSVDDANNDITLIDLLTGLPPVSVDLTVPSGGDVIRNDRLLVGVDDTSPTYGDGVAANYDGITWTSYNGLGGIGNASPNTDLVFSVEGTKSIKVDSNLVPALGSGATLSQRYYDDENEISLVIGLSNSLVTSATDVNALGKGTVSLIPNRNVDHFIFRSSRYADDVINLRQNEIPQVSSNDIAVNIFGGVD